ncbi:MAG TPA: HAD-IB family hydrolase [Actinomycetota bacterium]
MDSMGGGPTVIREALAGKRILLTGATGFLGTALLERLVVDVPVERVDVVIRGKAASRLERMIAGSAFGPAADRLGRDRLRELFEAKTRPLAADLSVAAPEVAGDIDLVVHSAATVQFDPPIDQAFDINLGGSTRLYEACGGRPFIHVSTAYVAGLTRGVQREDPLVPRVDWRAEMEGARLVRADIERASREPDLLERLRCKAHDELSRTGPQAVARRTEKLRRDWMRRRLVRAGSARAQSLGWPDVYSFTKALTELALGELAADHPLAIIRPSIIESSLRHPYPGWIEGFRMAEPVILAYGRASFKEFTGIPEGVIDIIPVDLVVNAILAVAAQGFEGESRRPTVYHVCSGGRNPLKYRDLYHQVRAYFSEHPLPRRDRGHFRPPEWRFPGRRTVDKLLMAGDRGLDLAERAVRRLPTSELGRKLTPKVDRARRNLDFMKKYADLYGPYTEIESIYTDERVAALMAGLPPEDQRDFPFDPTAYTWTGYLQEIHLPAVTAPVRKLGPARQTPRVVVSPGESVEEGKPVLVVLDVEATMIESNVVESYLWVRLSELGVLERGRQIASLALKVPGLLGAERRDRGEFLRKFYRLYEGADAERVKTLARASLKDLLFQRLSSAAVRRIREHRAAGHTIIILTASVDFLVEPLAPLADEMVTAHLEEVDGRFTGDMVLPPDVGEGRAAWLRDYARQKGADLRECYVYADAISDLPLLEAAGNPVVVNPDAPLARVARERRWPVEYWKPDPSVPRFLLPELVP